MNLRGRQHGFTVRLDHRPGNQLRNNYMGNLEFNGLEMDSIGMTKNPEQLHLWRKLPKTQNIMQHLPHM